MKQRDSDQVGGHGGVSGQADFHMGGVGGPGVCSGWVAGHGPVLGCQTVVWSRKRLIVLWVSGITDVGWGAGGLRPD